MKIKFLLTLPLLLVFGLAGCSKNDESIKGGDRAIIVKLPDKIGVSRGVEEPVDPQTPNDKTELIDVTVFLMAGQSVNRVEEFATADITAGYMIIENVSAMVNNVIVVANKQGVDFSSAMTASAVKKFAFTVASQNMPTDIGIAGKTHMGEGIPKAPEVGDPEPPAGSTLTYLVAKVELAAITSRIEVGTVKVGEGIKSIALEGVFINNFLADGSGATTILNAEGSTYWETTPAATLGGATDLSSTPVTYTAAYVPTEYYDKGTAGVGIPAAKCYAYHVFSGELPHVVLPHVILLVKGEYETGYHEDDDDKYFLAWVTYTQYIDNSTTTAIAGMEPNKIYQMGLEGGLTIDYTDITDKPEKKNYNLAVNVTVAPWSVVTVTPEI